MFAVSSFTKIVSGICKLTSSYVVPSMNFSSMTAKAGSSMLVAQKTEVQPIRTRIYYNHEGKPETVPGVMERFFRLRNGWWIRPKIGRERRLWKKNPRLLHKLKQHVFVTKRQCWMLDKMVNIEHKVPHYYINDPYEVYHRKSNLPHRKFEPELFYP